MNKNMDFKFVRKGYSPKQVEEYHKQVSEKLKQLEQKLLKQDEDLKVAQHQLEKAQSVDEEVLTEHLGISAARLISAARKEAEASEKEAATKADDIRTQAKKEAEAILSKAETAYKERIEAARAEAQHLEAEAKSIRRKTLQEMSRRRKEIIAEIERLRAGRNRLLDSFESSQKVIIEVKEDLSHSLGEAKVVADRAAKKVMSRPEPTPEELEEEIAAAKLLNLPQSSFPHKQHTQQPQPVTHNQPVTDKKTSTPLPSSASSTSPTARPQAEQTSASPPKTLATEDVSARPRAEQTSMSPPEPTYPTAPKPVSKPVPVHPEPAAAPQPAKDVPKPKSDIHPADAQPDAHSLFERLKAEQTINKATTSKTNRPRRDTGEKTSEAPKSQPSSSSEPTVPDPEPAVPHNDDLPTSVSRPKTERKEKEKTEPKQEAEPQDKADISELSRTLERQLKQAIALDQNQVLDSLRQRRKKEMPPLESQTAAYLENINIAELEQAAGKNIEQLEQLILEYWVNPLRTSLEECFKNEKNDPQIEVRNSFRDFKQNECSRIAAAMAQRILN